MEKDDHIEDSLTDLRDELFFKLISRFGKEAGDIYSVASFEGTREALKHYPGLKDKDLAILTKLHEAHLYKEEYLQALQEAHDLLLADEEKPDPLMWEEGKGNA